MLISFFTNRNYTLGVDYSAHPDCIHQEDVEFDTNQQIAELIENDGIYAVKITDKPTPTETEYEKFARVFEKFSNPENLLDKESLEGVIFDNKQIGDLILQRVFGGNPHAQEALQTKVITMMLAKKQDATLLKEVMEFQAKINEIREFFGLSKM